MQKDVPFIWDTISQRSFDDLKHALMNTPLLHPSTMCEITSFIWIPLLPLSSWC
jgi:hypothetical protein